MFCRLSGKPASLAGGGLEVHPETDQSFDKALAFLFDHIKGLQNLIGLHFNGLEFS